jgi:hypothetical protein
VEGEGEGELQGELQEGTTGYTKRLWEYLSASTIGTGIGDRPVSRSRQA